MIYENFGKDVLDAIHNETVDTSDPYPRTDVPRCSR